MLEYHESIHFMLQNGNENSEQDWIDLRWFEYLKSRYFTVLNYSDL